MSLTVCCVCVSSLSYNSRLQWLLWFNGWDRIIMRWCEHRGLQRGAVSRPVQHSSDRWLAGKRSGPVDPDPIPSQMQSDRRVFAQPGRLWPALSRLAPRLGSQCHGRVGFWDIHVSHRNRSLHDGSLQQRRLHGPRDTGSLRHCRLQTQHLFQKTTCKNGSGFIRVDAQLVCVPPWYCVCQSEKGDQP